MYIMDITCFDEWFLFHVITERNFFMAYCIYMHFFLYKFIVIRRFDVTPVLLGSLKQVFWKKFAFYIH